MDAIVVDTERTGKECIQYVKSKVSSMIYLYSALYTCSGEAKILGARFNVGGHLPPVPGAKLER
jgi:predicted NUDIX family phosphoesterase